MSIYSLDWMVTGAHRSRLQTNCGSCLRIYSMVLGPEAGPSSQMSPEHCTLAAS